MRSLAASRRGRPRVTGYFSGMMADAVACVREPGRQPVSSAVHGAEALRAVFAVLAASGGRGTRPAAAGGRPRRLGRER
jgi:hypothetical protein